MAAVRVHAATLHGADPVPITIEVSLGGGIPGIDIVGLPDEAVKEARHRVRCALESTGFEIPRARITINLAPAELKKTGSGFDVPIAVGILLATSQIPPCGYEDYLLTGELALDGSVSGVRGGIAFALAARNQGLGILGNLGESEARVCGVEMLVLRNIIQLRGGIEALEVARPAREDAVVLLESERLDFADVIDQEAAKRAAVIAAAGHHGLLMVGPPGSGKSMIARRIPTILPPLSDDERLEAMLLHSVAGQPLEKLEAGIRPFRSPHHTATTAGLLGGGRYGTPGEVSLANNGVLFLDELPEFGLNTLQSLRQPLEDHEVHLVRVENTYTFPAKFQLVAAANPCPCGYLGDPDHACTCSPREITRYQSKIGGPIMDRIDMVVHVARPNSHKVVSGSGGMSSREMHEQVMRAVEFAAWRRSREKVGDVQVTAAFTEGARELLELVADNLALGGRGITRVSRVARTIADLSEEECVREEDVAEAAAYRPSSGLG